MGIGGFKKMIIVYFLRSLIYEICFILNWLLLGYMLLEEKLFHNKNKFMKKTRTWAMFNIKMLKVICGVNYKVLGEENITDGNFLVVSKHQSTWECYFLYAFLPDYPVCVVKKELMMIPIFGPTLAVIGKMVVDRNDGIASMKKLLNESRSYLKNGRKTFLIFPQGTRTPVNSTTKEYPYKPGLLGIASVNKLDILPISLNSGNIWPKGKFIKKPGVITVKIMPMIKYSDYKDIDKNLLMKKIEDTIESNQKTI